MYYGTYLFYSRGIYSRYTDCLCCGQGVSETSEIHIEACGKQCIGSAFYMAYKFLSKTYFTSQNTNFVYISYHRLQEKSNLFSYNEINIKITG